MPSNRGLLTWGCHAGIFMFGVALAILGALLPELFRTRHLDPSEAGTLFLFLNLGALLISVAGGPAFDRFGFKGILMVGSLLTSASLFLMGAAEAYRSLALASFLLGLGGGSLNAGTNVLVADLYPERRAAALSVLGIFFGFGALFIPLFVGTLLDVLTLQGILTVTGALALLPALVFLPLVFPRAKQAGGFPLLQAIGLLRHPLILLMGGLLFFQSGNEITSSGWMTTYLVQQLGISPAPAALYLAGFWGAVMVGRFVSSRVLGRIGEARLVQMSALSASLGLGLFILWPHPVLSALFVSWIGLSLAPIFPTILGQAASRFPDLSGTAFGILMSIALVGGMAMPWLTGHVAERVGLEVGLLLPTVGFVLVFLFQTSIKSAGAIEREGRAQGL